MLKKYICRVVSVLSTTEAAPGFQKAVVDLLQKVFCMLTFLLMCNYTEKSSKTINQALTCMKTYFSHENTELLQRIKTNRKYVLYGSSAELQITGIFPSVKQSSQKKSSQIPCFPLTFQPNQERIQQSNSARQKYLTAFTQLLNAQVRRVHFQTKHKTVVKLVCYLPLF